VLKEAGASVVAISRDKVEENKKTSDAMKLPFPLLADPELTVVKSLGLVHEKGGPKGDVSRPGTILVKRDGTIAWTWMASNIRERPAPEDIRQALSVGRGP
jgi:peroxiredoxin